MRLHAILQVGVLFVAAFAPDGAFANSYRIVDLGPNTYATGVDGKGEVSVVRTSHHGKRRRALVYSGDQLHLAPSQQRNAVAAGVSHGRVAGTIDEDTPVIWERRGEAPQTLTMPDSGHYGVARGINTAGDVAGIFNSYRCFLWSHATDTSIDLGALDDGDKCDAYAIDNRGRIYGRATSEPGYRWRAFVWHDGRMHRLPPLLPHGTSVAKGGNKAGDVVGSSYGVVDDEGDGHAVVWRNGVIQDLMPGRSGFRSVANGIDDAGTIVGQGYYYSNDGDPRLAVRFLPEGGYVYLGSEVVNREGWGQLLSATGISPDGVIVGYGVRDGGRLHGFMLVPGQ